MNNSFIHVAVAAIVNSKDEVLVSLRKQGTHLGGYWEFPGGKLEKGESVADGLFRELKEELVSTLPAALENFLMSVVIPSISSKIPSTPCFSSGNSSIR